MDGASMPVRRDTSGVGARAEAAVAAALVVRGWGVYLPAFGGYGRADLVYETDHRLMRVQCKSARLVGNDSITFRTCSNTRNVPRSYLGEIDEFGVYSPDLGRVYLVPIEGLPSRACVLRLGPPRNGQHQGLRWAVDYELRPP